MVETTQPKSNLGMILAIILGVLFLMVLAGGGFVYYKYSQAKTEVKNLKAEIETLNSQVVELQSQIDKLKAGTSQEENSNSSSSSTASSTCTKTGTMPTNSYVIVKSNISLISEADLANLTPWQLKVARNEIYARYGRPFVHKDLSCYFTTQSWYKVDSSYSASDLSVTENKNVATILNYEKKINSPCQSKDSGC